jgi:hypothetical protein
MGLRGSASLFFGGIFLGSHDSIIVLVNFRFYFVSRNLVQYQLKALPLYVTPELTQL